MEKNMDDIKPNSQLLIYQNPDGTVKIDVLLEEETVWLTQAHKLHVPDAWINHSKTKVGYEIPLNRHFYHYEPPRALEAIAADAKAIEGEIVASLAEITGSSEGLK